MGVQSAITTALRFVTARLRQSLIIVVNMRCALARSVQFSSARFTQPRSTLSTPRNYTEIVRSFRLPSSCEVAKCSVEGRERAREATSIPLIPQLLHTYTAQQNCGGFQHQRNLNNYGDATYFLKNFSACKRAFIVRPSLHTAFLNGPINRSAGAGMAAAA